MAQQLEINLMDIATELATAVAAALTAEGLDAAVKQYRSLPRETTRPEIQISVMEFDLSYAGRGADSKLEFAVMFYAPVMNQTDAQFAAAEAALLQIEQIIVNAHTSWRGAAYPRWQEIHVSRPSRRPISPGDLVQWRVGAVYLQAIL